MPEQQKNLVEYGLENVHFAVITGETSTGYTYGTPIPLPGGIELTMDPTSETMEVDADNGTYYAEYSNKGYEGSLKLVLLPDSFRSQCLGEVVDTTTKSIIEFSNKTSKGFALLYQFQGDKKNRRHVLYNCKASRPTHGSKTKGSDVNTTELNLRAIPRIDNKMVKLSTTEDTPEEAYNNFFKSVLTPAIS